MKTSFAPTAALLLLFPFCSNWSHAQPDINNAPKAENPANRAPRRARPDPNLTPEERLKWNLKREFSRLGADEATQEILLIFVQNERKARQELAEKSRPLQSALRAGALSDRQIAGLLNAYQVALEDEKSRRAAAIAKLEKTVDLQKSPKIDASLTLGGWIGDGPIFGAARGPMGRGTRGQNNRNANNRPGNNRPAPAPEVR